MNKHISLENKIEQPFIHGMINNQYAWGRTTVANAVAETNTFDRLGYVFDRKVQINFKTRVPVTEKPVTDSRLGHLNMLFNQRKCHHMLSGRVVYKLCGHGYDCVRCPYDQMLQDNEAL